jgi:ribose transport system permease protein
MSGIENQTVLTEQMERGLAPRSRFAGFALLRNPTLISALAIVLLIAVGAIVSPGFGTPTQLISMMRVASFLGLMAIGQTIVILSGGDGIDLSVGQVATLGAIIGARLMAGDNANLFIGIAVPLLVGAALGLVNGLGIVYLGIPPFVMTLGMTGVAQGIVLAYTGGAAGGRGAPALSEFVNGRWLFDIPGVVWIWIALIILVTLLLRRTIPGWSLYAIGTNRRAARLSGVPVSRTAVSAYIASGVFAVLGGLMMLGFTQSIMLDIANNMTLPTVSAVVIGGTLAAGGVGSYLGTAIGAMVLTVLTSFLTTLRMPSSWRDIISGLVLLGLLALYGRQKKLRA